MTETLNFTEKINNIVASFPQEKQKQVLDFVNFLQSQLNEEKLEQAKKNNISFLDATKEFAGCLDGGTDDLSTNKKYLEDLGKY